MDEQRSVNITYETLFELVRLEKSKDELQKLDVTFYQDVIGYLKEKYEVLASVRQRQQFLPESDKENIEKQITNIRRLIRDLYDRREKKIITIVLNKARTNAMIVDTQNMLPAEKQYYDDLVLLLEKNRKNILHNILELKLPSGTPELKKEEVFVNSDMKKHIVSVKFVQPVSKFVGPELEEYGPFNNDDVAELPKDVAQVLVFRKRAVMLNED